MGKTSLTGVISMTSDNSQPSKAKMESETTGPRIGPQKLSALLKQHGRGLEVYAAQWSLNPEDCVQETFVKLATLSPPPENCVAWLFAATRNAAISSLRSRQRRSKHESFSSWLRCRNAKSSDPANLIAQADETHRVVDALQTIDQTDRELVVLRIWSGLKWSQIAELKQTSTSTAQRNYAAAIGKLKLYLESTCTKKAT